MLTDMVTHMDEVKINGLPNPHKWITWQATRRCLTCGVFVDQAEANCWRPVETHLERMNKALAKVLADFTLDSNGTIYYKGVTDGSNING